MVTNVSSVSGLLPVIQGTAREDIRTFQTENQNRFQKTTDRETCGAARQDERARTQPDAHA
jgi:hypothetical protein